MKFLSDLCGREDFINAFKNLLIFLSDLCGREVLDIEKIEKDFF
ncbi:hypothetical protein AO373_0877 [Moraxella catarrhalis]|nr:hypothetical protein AO373_0877 [Moraxella catarrhalis]